MVGQRTTVDKWRPWPLLSRDQIEQSPSFKLDMSFKQEKKLRESACKVIGEAGMLGLHTHSIYLTADKVSQCLNRIDRQFLSIA